MIYEQLKETVEVNPDYVLAKGRADLLDTKVAELQQAIKVEDSKRRETELREELKVATRERYQAHGACRGIEEDIFKTLLACEYDFPREHPKFDRVYGYAYSHGHSSGYSEVELYFSDLADIVKDENEQERTEARRHTSACLREWQEFAGRLAKLLGCPAMDTDIENAVKALVKPKAKRKKAA
jgi:hypothetical protein